MKLIEDMTEPELRELTTRILDGIGAELLPDTNFCVLFWPPSDSPIMQYGSNCHREDMIKVLRECATRLEKKQDTPRT